MSCDNCDLICILITNDCFCKLTGIKGVDIDDISECVGYANECIELLINDCFDICDKDDPKVEDLKNSKDFKRLYAQLIKLSFICEHGSGQLGAKGFSKAKSDDLSEYEIISEKDLKAKILKQEKRVEALSTKFQKWFSDKFPTCVECEEEESDCGCTESKECNQCLETSCGCANSCDCPQSINESILTAI